MYLLYSLGTFLLLLLGTTVNISVDGRLILNFNQMANFCDLSTLLFLLVPCTLMLFCTNTVKDFWKAFLLMSHTHSAPATQYRRCFHTVKAILYTAISAGMLRATIAAVNLFHYMDTDVASQVGRTTSVVILSIFYPLVLCIFLLPVILSMKNAVENTNR